MYRLFYSLLKKGREFTHKVFINNILIYSEIT